MSSALRPDTALLVAALGPSSPRCYVLSSGSLLDSNVYGSSHCGAIGDMGAVGELHGQLICPWRQGDLRFGLSLTEVQMGRVDRNGFSGGYRAEID